MTVRRSLASALLILLLMPAAALGQSVNGAITGVVKDSSGGVVADVALTLRNIATDRTIATAVSGANGEYAFRNLPPAKYSVEAIKSGFQQVTHPDIDVTLSSVQRVDITLPIGAQETRVEVVGGSSVLSVTGTQEHGISPETLNQLPLLMNSGPRAAASFATLMPGVSTGGGNNAFDARINGGLQSGDEASLDGVSMQQGFMSQGGMVSIFQDFPMSPDMVSEVKVLTSNYAPEYGSSTSGQIMAVTKSGGSSFHGAAFEFHRDDTLKAKQWGADEKPPFKRNNYGANLGGPGETAGPLVRQRQELLLFQLRGLPADGGLQPADAVDPVAPGAQRRLQGLARCQRQPDPHLRSVTIRSDGQGGFIKDQFMGCDGNTPNVICPSRINPLVRPWLSALPTPTSGGPLNNYLGPAIPDTILGNSDYYMGRFDVQIKNNDHIFTSVWHQRAPAKFVSVLPQPIASEIVLGSTELVGQPAQLGPHVHQQPAEPHVHGVPEPERGVRLGEPELRG